MKYDKNTMNALQEAYKSVSEESEDDAMKYSDMQNIKRQKELAKKQKEAPEVKNKIVIFKKKNITDSYERRIKEAIEMSRKEYTSEEKTVKHKMTKDEFNRIPKDFRGGTKEKPRATVGITDEMGNTTPVSREVEIIKKKVVPEGVEKNCGCGETPCKTYGNVNEKKKEMDDKMKEVEDMRSLPTRMNLIKTKLRAMGLNMSHVLKGKELSEVIDYTLDEVTRYKKEKGYVVGGTKKPTSPKTPNPVLDKVKKSIYASGGKIMRSGSNQPKKVPGAKTTTGTNKFLNMQNAKKQTAADAKERGFSNIQNYVDTMAIYGGKKKLK